MHEVEQDISVMYVRVSSGKPGDRVYNTSPPWALDGNSGLRAN